MPKFTVQFVVKKFGSFTIEAKDSDTAVEKAEKMTEQDIAKLDSVEWDGDDVEIDSVDENEDDDDEDESDDDGGDSEDDDGDGA